MQGARRRPVVLRLSVSSPCCNAAGRPRLANPSGPGPISPSSIVVASHWVWPNRVGSASTEGNSASNGRQRENTQDRLPG